MRFKDPEDARERVETYRFLAQVNPRFYGAGFFESLAELSLGLVRVRARDAARDAWEEAVQVSVTLPDSDLRRCLPDVAEALLRLADGLDADERDLPDALTAVDRAVEVCRRLVELEPGGHRVLLGSALAQPGSLLRYARHEDALIPAVESVQILRGVASTDPLDHLVLPASLRELSFVLEDNGNIDEALDATAEECAIYERLVAEGVGEHLPGLVDALAWHGTKLVQYGRETQVVVVADKLAALLGTDTVGERINDCTSARLDAIDQYLVSVGRGRAPWYVKAPRRQHRREQPPRPSPSSGGTSGRAH